MKTPRISSLFINNIIQFVLIFSSVYFAFWLTNLGQLKEVRKTEKMAIDALHAELTENYNQLKASYEYHLLVRDRLKSYLDSIEQRKINCSDLTTRQHLNKMFTRKASSLGLPIVENNAWDMLQNSISYIHLDYKLASDIGRLYTLQELGVNNTVKVIINEIYNNRSIYRPEETKANLYFTYYTLRELVGQEVFLMHETKILIKSIENHYRFIEDSDI